jgi:hypothetical protein
MTWRCGDVTSVTSGAVAGGRVRQASGRAATMRLMLVLADAHAAYRWLSSRIITTAGLLGHGSAGQAATVTPMHPCGCGIPSW